MKPHKHAELIKAWADGAEIQINNGLGRWEDINNPAWCNWEKYRIKPEPKPDVARFLYIECGFMSEGVNYEPNLKLTFDGETGELKSAEVLK